MDEEIESMRKARNTDRTRIVRLEQGMQPAVTELQLLLPSEELYTRDFSRLLQAPPFQVNLCGVVTTVGEEVLAQNSGRPMRSFHLQDQTGRWVQCSILGRHVENRCLTANAEVILYFASASRPSSPNAPSQLCLYDDSHLVLLRMNAAIPPARTQIAFVPERR